MLSVILAIDTGSSSIRCTGYEYHGVLDGFDFEGQCPYGVDPGIDARYNAMDEDTPPPYVKAIDGIGHTIKMASIVPSTGNIRIHEVLAAIDDCIDEVLRLLRQRMGQDSSYQILAVGFSTFAMNLVGTDEIGEPVGEAATLSYACNRADVVEECQSLRSILGPEKVSAMYQRTGTPLHPAYAVPQLLAFYNDKKNIPLIQKIEKWHTISAICMHRWSGMPQIQMPMSHCEASWTGMYNFRESVWDDDIVDLLDRCNDLSPRPMDEFDEDNFDILPPLVDFDAALPIFRGGIPRYCDNRSENSYWGRWPEFRSRSLHFFLGIGDGAAANVGSKCGGYTSPHLGSHRIALTIGTSAAARVCLPIPMGQVPPSLVVPPGLFCYRVDRYRILLGGALTDGGSVVEWARSLLNLQESGHFDACLEEVSKKYNKNCTTPIPNFSSRNDIAMIPFLTGERSVGFRGGAQGCVSGITRETTAADIMYGSLESVTLRLGCVVKLLNQACCSYLGKENMQGQGVLIASGNALEQNSLWRQMLADCSNIDVVVDGDSSEGTSRGIALMILGSLQQHGCSKRVFSLEEPLLITHEAKANTAWPTVGDHWRNAMSTQESLINAIAPTWRKF